MIEPAAGADRAALAFLVDAYDEEEVAGDTRTVLRLHPRLAPVKVAVLPLIGKDEGMTGKARPLYEELRRAMSAEYDDSASIGKRYRRQDEIGTPWALTIDSPDARGRHDHDPRPRLARAGADPDRGRAGAAPGAAARALDAARPG